MAVEKGQKYKGKHSGNIYEVLSEPFVHEGSKYVALHSPHDAECYELIVYPVDGLMADHYTLIVEPKYKVGDIVTDAEEEMTIEGVSNAPDKRGNFMYLVRDDGGLVFAIEERCIAGEVSS